jgi:ribosomal protein L32
MAETGEQRRERRKHDEIISMAPKCCPKCGGTELVTHITEWFAHSLEPQDIMNSGILYEHQCENCAISFWM